MSDLAVLSIGALGTSGLALAVALVSRRFLFSGATLRLDDHGKLAELVHGSLLGFTVFVLALVLSDVRSNLGKASDSVLTEAFTIQKLDRELKRIADPQAAAVRADLRAYVQSVATSEWSALGAEEPSLSADTERAMTRLDETLDTLARGLDGGGDSLDDLMTKIEEFRSGRLEMATKSVPEVFWWVVTLFLLGAMVMNGRHPLDLTSGALITLHMGAIGLVLGLIIVMDEPFRGESSVSPAAIVKAVERP